MYLLGVSLALLSAVFFGGGDFGMDKNTKINDRRPKIKGTKYFMLAEGVAVAASPERALRTVFRRA